MCGIVGFAGSDPELLEQMLRSIVHRGPDGQGTDVGTHFSIGMRRLAIIDVATGDQPLYSDDRNLALVFNGEIYNHAELRRELERAGPAVRHRPFRHRGHPARASRSGAATSSTTSPACSRSRSRDHERGELFLARDRLGIKPLYYVDGAGRVRVRVGAEGAVPGRTRRPPPRRRRAASLPVVPRARRRRGHVLRRREAAAPGPHDARPARRHREDRALLEPAGESRSSRRVEATTTTRRSSRAASTTSCKRHLISDVPVGVPLSGGLDSSGVVSTMARLMSSGTNLHTAGLFTFSALYPGESIDESEYIREVERAVGSIPHYAYPQARRLLERDRRMDLVPGGTDDRVGAVRVLLRVPARERAREGDGQRERRRRAARRLHPLLPHLSQLRDRAAPLSRRRRREIVKGRDLYKKYAGELVRSRLPGRATNPVNARELLEPGSAAATAHFQAHKNLNERLASDVLAVLDARPLALRGQELDGVLDRSAGSVPRPRARRVHLLAAHRPEDQGRMEPRGVPQRDEGPHAGEEPAAALEDRLHESRHHLDEGEGAARSARSSRRPSSRRATSTTPPGS